MEAITARDMIKSKNLDKTKFLSKNYKYKVLRIERIVITNLRTSKWP